MRLRTPSEPFSSRCSIALRVCETFLNSTPVVKTDRPRAFIYISAEDCNRPVVPSGYIETKREAELLIEKMVQEHPGFRSVYIRPSSCLSPRSASRAHTQRSISSSFR